MAAVALQELFGHRRRLPMEGALLLAEALDDIRDIAAAVRGQRMG